MVIIDFKAFIGLYFMTETTFLNKKIYEVKLHKYRNL